MLGATNPCLSETLKAALDRELAGAPNEDLPASQAWGRAVRELAANHPEAFDPDNQDDSAIRRLAPVLFGEDGSRTPPDELWKRVEPPDHQTVAHDKGSCFEFAVTVANADGTEFRTARFTAPAKDKSRQPSSLD